MPENSKILVVAATSRELAPLDDRCRTICCGVGPVEAAVATAAAIATERPALVLHVGIAGARHSRAIAPATIVIGTESRYCDLAEGLPSAWATRSISISTTLIEAGLRAEPGAVVLPIGTSARIGGTSGCDVEAMEGFGVLRAAQSAGVPAIEVRAISNDIEEADRSRWHFEAAFAAITRSTPRLVNELLLCVN
jgi:hypothetical protein